MRRGGRRGASAAVIAALFAGLLAALAVAAGAQGRGAERASPDQRREIMGLGALASPAQIEAGHSFFEASCAFCHGADARGGMGPDLLESDVVLDDVGGAEIGKVVAKGFPPRMPSFQLTPEQLTDLAAFLHSRVLAVANLAHGQYKLPFAITGDARAGEAYFNGAGGCSRCHSPTGDLAHIAARYTPLQIQNMFLTGQNPRAREREDQGDAPPRVATVTLPSGRAVTGAVRYLDDFNVVLVDSAGNVHSLVRGPGVRVQFNNPLAAHQALLSRYTDANIHNLTAYLVTLK